MSGAVGGWGALRASPDYVLSRPFSGSSPDESPVVPAARRHLKRRVSPEREESGEGEEMESGGGGEEEGSAQADSDSGSLWVCGI
jgi:hypothetical protein